MMYGVELQSLKVLFGEKGGKAEKADLVMQLAFWQKIVSKRTTGHYPCSL